MASSNPTPSSPPDTAFLVDLRKGKEAAVERLLEEHETAIFAYLRARMLGEKEARRLCGDVFVAACQAPNISREADLRKHLISIASSRLENYARRGRQGERAWIQACLQADSAAPPLTKDPSSDRSSSSNLPDSHRLDAVSPSERETLRLHYGAGLSTEEISQKLRRSVSAVRQLLKKAREGLSRSGGEDEGGKG